MHDPLGRRIAKKINGTIVEKYLWQGLTRLLAVYDGSDNFLMRFEYAGLRMPVAVTYGGTTYYMAYDQVGSLRAVADSASNMLKSIEYDSFGNVIDDSNPAFYMPFGFAGGLYDADTGLVRFGFRDYDPDVGRWTAKDPILFAGGDTDLYGYVLNDPVNAVDPIGLEVWNPSNYPISPEVQKSLDQFNTFIGEDRDIVITGGDRPADSTIGSGSSSTHTKGLAADIKVMGWSHIKTANKAADSGLFGGIGWYQEGYIDPKKGVGPHVHVDLRKGLARWGYDSSGRYYKEHFPGYKERRFMKPCD